MLNKQIYLTVNGKLCKVDIHKEALMFDETEKKSQTCKYLQKSSKRNKIILSNN